MEKYKKQKCDECGATIRMDLVEDTTEVIEGDERHCLPLRCARCDAVLGLYCQDCIEDFEGCLMLCDACQPPPPPPDKGNGLILSIPGSRGGLPGNSTDPRTPLAFAIRVAADPASLCGPLPDETMVAVHRYDETTYWDEARTPETLGEYRLGDLRRLRRSVLDSQAEDDED